LLLQAERGRKRLDFLLKQAEVFQHFAPVAASQSAKKKGRHGTAITEEQEDEALLADEEGGAEGAGHRLQVGPAGCCQAWMARSKCGWLK
jgi:SWI/SNF-related matrix-associated actin-dependent regulator of chromatin subfamily A member 5